MNSNRNVLSGKNKYLFGLILVLLMGVVCVAFSMAGSDDFDISRREILLRSIGHQLLLQSGDSTSRVLPVKKINENEYQVSFEKEFSFRPDSLVNTTLRLLGNDPLASDYVVNVLKCGSPGVAYGYAISKNKKDDIVACIGRVQPKACYLVNIKFKPAATGAAKAGYILAGLPFLALVGFVFFRRGKPQNTLPAVQDTGIFNLGPVLFDAKGRKLLINEKAIDLTGTETRLLLIFASSPNEIIERSRLQKEIWEDQGIIVGRSLDMFISKLRKKLEAGPGIKISVVRSKGYKLEVEA